MDRAARRAARVGAGRGRSCRAQETFLGMVPAAAARAAEVPGPVWGALPAPGPLASPRPAPSRASGSLAAAGARLQRQRGPPGFVSVGLGVFCPGSGSSKKTAGRNRRRTPAPRSTSLTGVFLLLLPFLPPALRSPLSSLFPPSLRLGLRVSLGVTLLPLPGEGRGARRLFATRKKVSGCVFSFPLSLQSGLSSCTTSYHQAR